MKEQRINKIRKRIREIKVELEKYRNIYDEYQYPKGIVYDLEKEKNILERIIDEQVR